MYSYPKIGDMYSHLLCDAHRDHYDDPDWGDQTTGGTRGDDVYCCSLGKFLSDNCLFCMLISSLTNANFSQIFAVYHFSSIFCL